MNEINKDNDNKPINHRIRPDDESIMDAIIEGWEYLKEQPQYEEIVKTIREYKG